MKPTMYAAAMSKAKEAVPPKEDNKIVEDLGMGYLNASPLHLAALQGDLDFVKTALGEIPQLAEAIDSRNQTPLHLASAEGHIPIVKELVSANVDTCTYQDIRGRNPLHIAVMKGHLDIVPELIKSPNVSDICTSRDLGGRNPLHVAAMNGKVDLMEELLRTCPLATQERGERDQTILHLSVKHNQLHALELLLVKPELQELVNAKDADGNTALHLAVAQATNIETPLDTSVYEGQINVIKTLVGVSVNMCACRDLDGRNPLHIAVMKGHLDIVQELVKSANVADMCTSCVHGGRNPLHVAAVNGKIDLMTELLNACPLAAQVRVDRDQTILHLCVEHNQLEALELQQLGNAKDADGNTALHLAVAQATNVETPLDTSIYEGQIKVIKTLVGVSVNMCASRDLDGRNPLHIAVMKGHLDIVQELVKSANVADMCTARDLRGRNPLHVAAIHGKVDIMKELIKACPLAAQGRADRDQTILHLCVEHNQLEALVLLLGNPKLQQLGNAKDADGNTALHLAVAQATNVEIVEALCCGNIDMNARNMNGQTALNMLPESEPKRRGIFSFLFLYHIRRDPRRGNINTNLQPRVREEEERKERIKGFMRVGGALRANQIRSADWMTRKKDSLMVVAALIATGTFQIGMSPPDSLKREKYFVLTNAVAFAGSLFAILLIASDYSRKSWFLLTVQTCAIAVSGSYVALTYATAVYSATTVKTATPRDNKVIKWIGISLYIYSFFVIFISCAGFFFTRLHFWRERRCKRRSMMRRNWPEHTIQDSPPQVTVSISNSANGSPAANGTTVGNTEVLNP